LSDPWSLHNFQGVWHSLSSPPPPLRNTGPFPFVIYAFPPLSAASSVLEALFHNLRPPPLIGRGPLTYPPPPFKLFVSSVPSLDSYSRAEDLVVLLLLVFSFSSLLRLRQGAGVSTGFFSPPFFCECFLPPLFIFPRFLLERNYMGSGPGNFAWFPLFLLPHKKRTEIRASPPYVNAQSL